MKTNRVQILAEVLLEMTSRTWSRRLYSARRLRGLERCLELKAYDGRLFRCRLTVHGKTVLAREILGWCPASDEPSGAAYRFLCDALAKGGA